MEINTFIFLFSILVFLLGFVSFQLTSKEFNKIVDGKFAGGPESGPRAQFYDALNELLSEDDEWEDKISNADPSEIKEIVRKMNDARQKK